MPAERLPMRRDASVAVAIVLQRQLANLRV